MPYFFSGDRKSTTCPAGASNVATSITVAAGAVSDFPTGPRMFEVQATGETIELTAGWGTTTWTITRAQNQTNAATIPAGAVLLEESGANEYSNFLQRDETALPTSMLATTTPIVDGTGAAGSSTKAARADHVHPSGGGGSGTVTSVGLSLPAEFTVTVSPITGSGTLTAVRANQSANTVQAGPTTGSPGAPTFRALVQADIPALDASQITTGTVAGARLPIETSSADTTAGHLVQASDTRLTNARTPTAHATTHGSGGTDVVSLDAAQVATGTLAAARLPAATTTTQGAVKPDNTSITISGGILSAAAAATPTGSYSGNAAPSPTPDSVSLLDRLRGGFVSPSPYTAIHGEFDLQWYNGVYYLATPNLGDTATELRHASTLLGLNSASLDVTVATQYPSILYDGTTWHLWGYNGSNDVHHWTASTFGGTYTHVDSVGLNVFDPQVRRNPSDGLYYMAYCANSPFGFAGIAKASSTSGPWTDLGLIFSGAGNPSLALQSYDPTPIFWNGRAYMGMSATPTNPASNNANCLLVELDPSNSYKVTGSPVVVASGPGGNPIFLARPDQPGQEKLFQLTLSGTGYTQVGPAPDDGRRALDGMRLNATTGADVATGLTATTHGGATWGPNGLKCAATPSGAYGHFGLNGLADFTATIEFSLSSLPGADALVLRVSPYAMGTNQIGLWVTSSGVLKATVIASGTLTLNGVTTLSTGVVYRATLLRFGSTVSLLLNGAQETSGTQGSALSGLMEWAVGNDKGQSQASGEQFAGSIYRASISGEALQPVMDALGGLPTLGPVSAYTLPVATGSVLGGIKVGAGLSAAGDGTLSTTGASSGTFIAMQTGSVAPPIPLWSSDGTDYVYLSTP